MYLCKKTNIGQKFRDVTTRDRIARSRNLTDLIKLLVHQACAQPLAVTTAQQMRDKPPSEQLTIYMMLYIGESIPLSLCGSHFTSRTLDYPILEYLPTVTIPCHTITEKIFSCRLCDCPCFVKFGRTIFSLGAFIYIPGRKKIQLDPNIVDLNENKQDKYICFKWQETVLQALS